MPWTIWKRFEFSASHWLEGMPEGHPCARIHGHNYVVELELTAQSLGPEGWVKDYGELAPFREWLDHHLDHRHLNDVLHDNPTAELVAIHLFNVATCACDLDDVSAVRVYETPKTCAEFRP
jgi:6-pyruvoyltetrahydropterin/6-carboxytetrahydropterin synthase